MRLGTIKKAKEIGYKNRDKYIWQACIDCGKERWVGIRRGKPVHFRCHSCAMKVCKEKNQWGENNPNWRGGKTKNGEGYVLVWVNGKDIRENRLVMENHLGRELTPNEIVHHKNENKDDNRLENLELMTNSEHNSLHKKGGETPNATLRFAI